MAHPLALPKTFSPDTLDTTAELAIILERLQTPPAASSAATLLSVPGADATPGAGSGATPQAQGGGVDSGMESGSVAAVAGSGPISFRDLPTATDSLKHKLQHARAQIKTLPDMGRTVAQQEAEIRALEARMRKQKAVLVRLREEGQRFAAAGSEQQQQPPPPSSPGGQEQQTSDVNMES